MSFETVGENTALITRELNALVRELVPAVSTYEESGKTIFFYRRNICYIERSESSVKFGFFGDDLGEPENQKAVCYFTFTSAGQIDKGFMQKLLRIYINS
jgi:hypothetical protein